jgi:hypothetical protein
VSITVPSTHLMTATGSSVIAAAAVAPPQMAVDLLFELLDRLDRQALTRVASSRSSRRGLIAMPRSVTITSISSPGP